MSKKSRNEVKSVFFPRKVVDMVDDEKPLFTMHLLANTIIENCFNKEYMFRSGAMERRLNKHGALPKSFFRQNFQRSSKLLNLIDLNGYTLDTLVDEIVENENLFEKVELFDRKENKIFYKLIKSD